MEDFGLSLLPRCFSKRSNVFSQDLFEQLSRTAFFLENNNKDGVFILISIQKSRNIM